MRKFTFYAVIYAAGLMLQFGWAKYVSPCGISPNFLLVSLIFAGLMRGPLEGELLGFAWGISWDAMSTEMFGAHAFIFTCMGYLSGLLSRKWDESKISAQILLAGAASVFFLIAMKAVYGIFGSGQHEYHFNYITGLQPVYNMLIAPFVFWAGKRLSSLID